MPFNLDKTIVECDAAVGEIKLVNMPTAGLVKYIDAMYILNNTFGVHITGQEKPHFTLEAARENVHNVHETLTGTVSNVRHYSHSTKEVLQGPDGTPATKTVNSVYTIIDGVIELQNFIRPHN